MRILERRAVQFIAVSAVEPKRIGTNLSDSPVCPKWGPKSGGLTVGLPLPVFSEKRTIREPVGTSQKCHDGHFRGATAGASNRMTGAPLGDPAPAAAIEWRVAASRCPLVGLN
jgi:hypothetical protein